MPLLQLLGRWPAKVYLVFEVPHTVGSVSAVDCVPSLFETELEAMFDSVGITTFAFPDGIKSPFVPIKVRGVYPWSIQNQQNQQLML